MMLQFIRFSKFIFYVASGLSVAHCTQGSKINGIVGSLSSSSTSTGTSPSTPHPTSTVAPTPTASPNPTMTPDPLPSSTPVQSPPPPGSVSISNVQGQWTHQNTIVITGANFGTKANAAPLVWDDTSGTDPHQKWDFVHPDQNDSAFQMQYRTPAQVTLGGGLIGGIGLPHSHVSKYLAGAHYNSGSTNFYAGYNVCAGKNHQQGQTLTYISFYRAIDPHWHQNQNCSDPADCDHNFKEYDYASDTDYMGTGMTGDNYYFGNANPSDLFSHSIEWGINYAEANALVIIANPNIVDYYPTYGTVFSKVSVPAEGLGWQKVEYVLHHSTNGQQQIFQDNKMVWDVNVNDQRFTSGTSSISETIVGGFAREVGSTDAFKNNWRYYTDIYYDHSLSRVILANASDYNKATVLEPQIPSQWNTSQITVKANLGKFQAGQTAYIFVFDNNNGRNAVGYPITITGP